MVRIPYMYVSILDCRDLDLAKDNCAVGSDSLTHGDQVILHVELDEVSVRNAFCTSEHLGLVFVPVVTQFNEFRLDLALDCFEGGSRLWGRRVRIVKLYDFGSC